MIKRISLGYYLFIGVMMLIITACSDEGPEIVNYNCTQPCLQSVPVLSTNTISSATGGVVDIDLNFAGDVSQISRVDIFLQDINSGGNVGQSITYVSSASVSIPITVDSLSAVGTYFPYVIIYTTATGTNNRYYRDPDISKTNYTFFETEAHVAQSFMIAPFSVPYLTVN